MGSLLLIGLWGKHVEFRPLDFASQISNGRFIRTHTQPLRSFHDQVRFVLDQSWGISANRVLPKVLQLRKSSCVKGFCLDTVGAQISQPGAHFSCGTGGEGHCQDVIWVINPCGYPIGDAVGNRAGFTCSGTCQDTDRSGQGGGCLALFSVQAGEDLIGSLQSNSLKFWVAAMAHRTSGARDGVRSSRPPGWTAERIATLRVIHRN